MHDTARHSGLVQHAYPLGRDWLAACGFRTPLQRAFDGVLRPLLAMPGVYNPRCTACAALVAPPVAHEAGPAGSDNPAAWLGQRLAATPGTGAEGADPRPMRPAIGVPVVPAWPLADLEAKARLDARPATPTVIPVRSAPIQPPARPVTAVPAMAATAEHPDAVAPHAAAARPASAAGAMRPSTVLTAGPDGRRAFVVEDRAERLHR
jgi:hypothetical protein